jgi:hypothetical protein
MYAENKLVNHSNAFFATSTYVNLGIFLNGTNKREKCLQSDNL